MSFVQLVNIKIRALIENAKNVLLVNIKMIQDERFAIVAKDPIINSNHWKDKIIAKPCGTVVP